MNLHPRRVSNKSNVRPETDIEGRRKQRKEESLNVKRFFISFGDNLKSPIVIWVVNLGADEMWMEVHF